jgi:integrase
MPLTDTKLRALKNSDSSYKVSDGEGLHVFVVRSGSKLWRLAYRHLGKQKTLALGSYPAVSLREARRARDDAKDLLRQGVDPGLERKQKRRQKLVASANTFETTANEWFEAQKDRWVESYAVRLRARLDEDLLPQLGGRPIAEIKPIDVLDAIRAIERRNAIEMAKRVMQMVSAIFRYGVATSRCERDPTVDLKGALKPARQAKHRIALPAVELGEFLVKLNCYDGEPATRLGLKLVVHTFVRTSELRLARWSEFENLDGASPLWRIPADRMKQRRTHLVPLSVQVVGIVNELKRLAGPSTYLFPSMTGGSGVVSENTLLFALYRLGYHSRATVHGFRATASTILNERQFNRDWIEMQLAHFDGSVRGVYNAAEWLPGRRDMLAWWSSYLDGAEHAAVGEQQRPAIDSPSTHAPIIAANDDPAAAARTS